MSLRDTFSTFLTTEIEKNKKEAMRYEKAGKLDCPAALCILGWGKQLEEQWEAAADYYAKAAAQGHAESLYRLARLYEWGKVIPKDKNDMVKYYIQSANLGYIDAQYALGNLYRTGKALPEKKDQSVIYYFTMAAKNGHTQAQYELAKLYDPKKYPYVMVPESKKCSEAAVRYYLLAAKGGDLDAQYDLAEIIEKGEHGVARDPQKALLLFRAIAEKGHHGAGCYLKKLYRDKNASTAQTYYSLMAFDKPSEMKEKFSKLLRSPDVLPLLLEDEKDKVLALAYQEKKSDVQLRLHHMLKPLDSALPFSGGITFIIVSYVMTIHASWGPLLISIMTKNPQTLAREYFAKGMDYFQNGDAKNSLRYFNKAVDADFKIFPKIVKEVKAVAASPSLPLKAAPLAKQVGQPDTQLGKFLRRRKEGHSRWERLTSIFQQNQEKGPMGIHSSLAQLGQLRSILGIGPT